MHEQGKRQSEPRRHIRQDQGAWWKPRANTRVMCDLVSFFGVGTIYYR